MNKGNTSYFSSKIKWFIYIFSFFLVGAMFPDQMHNVALVLGLGFIGKAILTLVSFKNLSNRKEVKGRILNIEEKDIEVFMTPTATEIFHYPIIEYEYEINKKTYRNNKIGCNLDEYWAPEVNLWGEKAPNKDKFWYGWSADSIISIFINPKNDADSLLKNQVNKDRIFRQYILIVIGLICCFVWFNYVFRT